MNPSSSFLSFAALMAFGASALAHVSVADPRGETGTPHTAVFRLGHGCDGSPTTSVTVRVPAGFDGARPVPRAGWNLSTQGGAITWTAASREAALPSTQAGEFAIAGTLARTPGPLWFKVLQTCDKGSLDWAQVPAQGMATTGLQTPAALLQVMSPAELAAARALPKVEGAWVRGTVPGQQGTGAFMRITASEPMQLVGVATPVAGTAEVHEMKMEGDVMRMRAVPSLDLPAGRAVELKPGGYHVMLMELKQPLAADTVVPLTLLLRNAKGVESRLELKLPVRTQPPGGAKAGPTDGHKH